jgi:hypothetical protein
MSLRLWRTRKASLPSKKGEVCEREIHLRISDGGGSGPIIDGHCFAVRFRAGLSVERRHFAVFGAECDLHDPCSACRWKMGR